MKKAALFAAAVLLVSCKAGVADIQETDNVKLNSLGFLPSAAKTAVITNPDATEFRVIDINSDKVAFKGTLSEPVSQEDYGQTVRIADFSSLKKKSSYVVDVPGTGKSYAFEINDNAYADAFYTSMRGFYLWRCGMAVSTDHNGIHYETEACHLDDGYTDYVGEPGGHRDGTGGWHDAGDFGKYTVNAGITVGTLFYAWEHFQDKLAGFDLGLPETAPGYPQFLEELKWETDFILKMQYPDGTGRVSHKLTRTAFADFIMPQEDDGKRYFTEWGTAATADFVAMMAMSARYFKPYDEAYAQKCLDAALVSWNCLKENPEKFFVQGDFSTGGYQTFDRDDRLWAAAEMWETTGEKEYLDVLESGIKALRQTVADDWDWEEVSNMAVFTYALSKRDGKDAALVEQVNAAVKESADRLAEHCASDIYDRALERFYWGCNGTMGRQAINLHVADMLFPDAKYGETILKVIGHMFGNNYYGRSYVTGLGVNPPMHPHDRRSGADGIEEPWPGYVVGGGHKATDWVDEQEDYSRNEIAINWQAGLVYLLAAGLR